MSGIRGATPGEEARGSKFVLPTLPASSRHSVGSTKVIAHRLERMETYSMSRR
jgi:hypothetical protein